MHDTLASQLDALGLNGKLRRANLRNLVARLTSREVRHLREQLDRVDLRMDIVANLPVELRVEVAGYIGPFDVFNVLNVSKGWRALWTQLDVLQRLADRFLPGFVKYYRLVAELNSERPDWERLFCDSMRRFRARSLSKPRLVRRYELPVTKEEFDGDDFKLSPDSPPFSEWPRRPQDAGSPRYTNGRLAWQPSNTQVILVDDFRSCSRSAFLVPDLALHGHTLRLLGLGDQLVVALSERMVYCSPPHSARGRYRR